MKSPFFHLFGVRVVVGCFAVERLLSIFFIIGYTIGPYLIAVLITLFSFMNITP